MNYTPHTESINCSPSEIKMDIVIFDKENKNILYSIKGKQHRKELVHERASPGDSIFITNSFCCSHYESPFDKSFVGRCFEVHSVPDTNDPVIPTYIKNSVGIRTIDDYGFIDLPIHNSQYLVLSNRIGGENFDL